MLTLLYMLPIIVLVFHRFFKHYLRDKYNVLLAKEEFDAGLTESVSLHPLIDPLLCLGCGTCVLACPEKQVIGIVRGKAELIKPTHCIGHGACATACPVDAITLVFGSERRGVEIPLLTPSFETSVEGLFIAGELGGMGLIRNAIKQGREAMAAIKQALQTPSNVISMDTTPVTAEMIAGIRDVVIVGAGPAGISASLAAKEAGLSYVTLEQEAMGGTITHYPKGKVVMTSPAELPLVGKTPFTIVSKEDLIAFLRGVVEKHELQIEHGHKVESVTRKGNVYEVKTNQAEFLCRKVLLAIGRRGTPRKLGVKGEDMSKVVYRMVDSDQYHHQHVLVVGGGDSALEAATSIAELGDTHVTLSYRGEAFDRAKSMNRARVTACIAKGSLEVMFQSQVKEILSDMVVIKTPSGEEEIKNDTVIVCAGGELPTKFLNQTGIFVETKYGRP